MQLQLTGEQILHLSNALEIKDKKNIFIRLVMERNWKAKTIYIHINNSSKKNPE